MCYQQYRKCRNNSCSNAVEMLSLIDCTSKPRCQTQLVRLPLHRSCQKQHCDKCLEYYKLCFRDTRNIEKQHSQPGYGKTDQMPLSVNESGLQIDAREDERLCLSSTSPRLWDGKTTAAPAVCPDRREPLSPTIQVVVSDEGRMDAAQTLLVLSQGTTAAPSMPPSKRRRISPPTPPMEFESAESEDEAHDAAMVLMAMSLEQIRAPLSSRPGPKKVRFPRPLPISAPDVCPDRIEPLSRTFQSVVSDERRMDAAQTIIALSQGTAVAPSVSPSKRRRISPTTPFTEFESAESEDEAHDVALTLMAMSLKQTRAPPSSRLGPKKVRFPRPPRTRAPSKQEIAAFYPKPSQTITHQQHLPQIPASESPEKVQTTRLVCDQSRVSEKPRGFGRPWEL